MSQTELRPSLQTAVLVTTCWQKNAGSGQSRHLIRFDILPDDVLLEIFDFYLINTVVEAWKTLAHVCRRWRSLVFGSPRRLNLRLLCTPEICTRDKLDVWPALLLDVWGIMDSTSSTDNIIAALQQSNRVYEVELFSHSAWQLEQVSETMDVPFPELTDLLLWSIDKTTPIIPNSFLGGSAPRLRRFVLNGILFPRLPNLLLSATHLVDLWLSDIPYSGDISPAAIVALLCVSSGLKEFYLRFRDPQCLPDWEIRRPHPPKRSILPALEDFTFKGTSEYLEDLVCRIDTPQLGHLRITFKDQINFDCPQLTQFVSRTPNHRHHDKLHIQFDDWIAGDGRSVILFGVLRLVITCRGLDQRLSSVARICTSHIPSTIEDLYINRHFPGLGWQAEAIETTSWLQLLLPFVKVKNLYLRKGFVQCIVATLQELVGDRTTEVLPSLENIFVEELQPFEEDIGQFVVARRLSGHPVAISKWGKGSDTKSM